MLYYQQDTGDLTVRKFRDSPRSGGPVPPVWWFSARVGDQGELQRLQRFAKTGDWRTLSGCSSAVTGVSRDSRAVATRNRSAGSRWGQQLHRRSASQSCLPGFADILRHRQAGGFEFGNRNPFHVRPSRVLLWSKTMVNISGRDAPPLRLGSVAGNGGPMKSPKI